MKKIQLFPECPYFTFTLLDESPVEDPMPRATTFLNCTQLETITLPEDYKQQTISFLGNGQAKAITLPEDSSNHTPPSKGL